MTGGRYTRPPVFCVLATLAFAGALVACGGDDNEASSSSEEPALEVPEGAVAFVDEVEDGEVTQDELDAIIQYRAISQGLDPPLAEGTPEYGEVLPAAFFELLLNRWARGEAGELGITVTETQIDAELETIVSQQYASQEDYEQFLEDSGLTEEDARARVEYQLLTEAIRGQVAPPDLKPQEQEEAQAEFQEEFTSKWRDRTVCSEDLLADVAEVTSVDETFGEWCSNIEAPSG
jgi:SurA N-terminal domain